MDTIKDLVAARYAQEPGAGADMAADGAIAGILSRRSCRRYTERPVPGELLDVLLACAQSAPTKSNLQQYSMLVVRDPDVRKRLAPLCVRTKGLEDVPLLVIFLADMRRGRRLCEMRGHAHANNNLDSFLNATIDAALALGFFVIAAEAAGLGCAPLSSLRDEIAGVSEVLGLPDGVFPIAGLMAGWPADTGHINQRLPQSVVVHRDRYDDADLEARIADYDERRHAIFPVAPEKQRHTDRYGVADFYGWSEAAARQLSLPERAGLRDFLHNHGFDLA